MKTAKRSLMVLGLVGGSLMSACGGGGSGGAPLNQGMAAQALDTMQVLVQARVTSEASTPFAVNDGALVLTDTSETATPISINAM